MIVMLIIFASQQNNDVKLDKLLLIDQFQIECKTSVKTGNLIYISKSICVRIIV